MRLTLCYFKNELVKIVKFQFAITTRNFDELRLQDARYVIKSVICDPNFERLVLGCIEADFCK